MFELRQNAQGKWYRPDPELCALGMPMTRFLRGAQPHCSVKSGGHMWWRCDVAEHGHTEADYYVYWPPRDGCCTDAPYLMAPNGRLIQPG